MFGKWLMHELKEIACELVLLTRDSTGFLNSFPKFALENITFVEGDVRDFQYPEGHFDYVIHAATPVVSDKLSDTELTDIIVAGTKRVLDFATQSGCPRLLYISSGAVYGATPPELDHIPESFPCNPITTYGKGKLIAENLCLGSQVECVIARCFAFVGPGMPLDAHFAIGNFMGSCLKNEPILINGDGTPLRSYMYSSDLADWLITLLIKGRIGETYNVGSEEAISIINLAELVFKLTKKQPNFCIAVSPQKNQLPKRYIPSISKAKQDIGLECRVRLQEAILLSL